MWRDVRGALRGLAKRPGFAAAVLTTLALGIGANSAVYTVVNAVLIRNLPFADSERLVSLEFYRRREGTLDRWMLSLPNFLDLRDTVEALDGLVAYSQSQSLNLTVGGETSHVWGELVSAGYFETLGIRPFLGRTFTAEEDRLPGGRPVALISHSLWKRYYEGKRSLQERPVRLVDAVYQVVGVAPPGFHGLGDEADVWVPVATAAWLFRQSHYTEARGSFWLLAAARLADGYSLAQAQAALDAATARLEVESPQVNEGIGARLVPLKEALFGDLRLALLSLLGGAGFVLLIACTNVSNLLLARTLERQRELAIRTALGAARWRLVRQVLSESVALALAGGLAGIFLAHWTAKLLIASSAIDLPRFVGVGVDLPVLGVMTAVSVACGLGFGLMPAFTSSRLHLSAALKEGAQTPASSSRGRLQSALIGAEMALAFVLLAGAFHILESFERIRGTDLGFRTDNLATLRLDLSGQSFAGRDVKRRVAQTLEDGLAAVPGVEQVALAGPNLPIDEVIGFPYAIENQLDEVLMQYHLVSTEYFDMLGIPILEGRGFLATDTPTNLAVTVVSADAARRFWPGESALGKRIKPGGADNAFFSWNTVVGVVGATNQVGFRTDLDDYFDVYFYLGQSPNVTSLRLNVLLRTAVPPDGALLARLRSEVQKLVPNLPAYDVRTIDQRLAEQIKNRRLQVLLMSLFTGLALILAAVGIYGLLAYLVAQKRRDFGVRLALGAGRGDLFRRVVGRAAALALAGIAAGAAATGVMTPVLASRFPDLVGADPRILGGIAVLLLVLALASSSIPAWRATRIDPNTVLREE